MQLRIKAFFGTSTNAVKTQIWIAVSVYVLVAIVRKHLGLEARLYQILQILSLTLFEKTPIIVETAPWIHPCYRGCLTLEIANVSHTPLLLYRGRFIAQVILMEVRPKPPKRDVLQRMFTSDVLT